MQQITMSKEEWDEKMARIEENASRSEQLDKDAEHFLSENATIVSDYWEEGIICKHCGKSYFLDMYHSGQLQLGKMMRNFYNHMVKVHNYKDESFCGLMKYRMKDARFECETRLNFTRGDH